MGTKATNEELGRLGVVQNRLFEFVKDGKRPADQVVAAIQQLADGVFPVSNPFDAYTSKLLPLWQQLNLLKQFNVLHWDNILTEEEIDAVDTSSDHVQSVDDLEILYVDFGSAEKNIEMWWRVLVANQPNNWRWDGLKTDPENLRLTPNTKAYEPGIHRVRINLVAHWEPENGRTIDEVREQAKQTDEILAHAEVLAAYGLHAALLQEQDGENLPYADMPGFQATVPGREAWAHVPYLFWNRDDRKVQLSAFWSGSRPQYWAAPVVRES